MILRSPIVWHKPNPMPESTTDRPTSSYEMVFLLAKSYDPQFWTHRGSAAGTRDEPDPDYRWQDILTGLEYAEEPPSYSDDMVACPACSGEGEITVQAGQVSMFNGIPASVKECSKCEGEGEIKRWKRTNLWQSHDYFYDADAVQEPSASGPSDMRKMIAGKERIGGKHKDLVDPLPKASSTTNIGQRRAVGSPNGRNVRNVWTFPTQGRPDAHFATFPDELAKRCILAGTSEKGVCGECGAPWSRMVERTAMEIDRSERTHPMGRTRSSGTMTKPSSSTTLGWQPTCGHNSTPVQPSS